MNVATSLRSCVFAALITAHGLGLPTLSYGQDAMLIHACVSSKGDIRIITPEGVCNARETRVTWPAEPSASVTFYQRVSPAQLVAEGFATAIALCDDPDDVATGGGFQLDGVTITDPSSVLTSTSCAASGLCGGTAGADGWVVRAKSMNTAAQGTRITAYVVCAQP